MKVLTDWRQSCLDLPFEEVTEVVHFSADEIERLLEDRSDPHRWFLIQAGMYVPLDSSDPGAGARSVDPVEVIGFTAFPGGECEPMNCFLARYSDGKGDAAGLTAMAGWQGRSFCKTQYASSVAPEHFLKCHVTVTAALDAAQAAGILESVIDEGEFWTERNPAKLLKAVDRWNASIAGFVGSMQDTLQTTLAAPIKSHPGFERLEHEGTVNGAADFARALAAALKGRNPLS